MLYQRFCKQITSPKQHINTYNFYFKHEIGAFSRAKVHLLLHTTLKRQMSYFLDLQIPS